jgi:hypothetical protein
MLSFNERRHIVGLATPVDTTSTTVNSDVVNMGKFHGGEFLVYFGTITGDTVVVTVEECDDVTPTNSTAIAFNYRQSGVTGTSDAYGAITAATSSGVTISATDDDKILAISVDSSELSAGFPYLRIVADPGGSASAVEIAILCILDPRYPQNAQITALT